MLIMDEALQWSRANDGAETSIYQNFASKRKRASMEPRQ